MLQWEHSAILLTFTKLTFVIKIFVLFIFEWPFYTCFTVLPISHLTSSAIILLRERNKGADQTANFVFALPFLQHPTFAYHIPPLRPLSCFIRQPFTSKLYPVQFKSCYVQIYTYEGHFLTFVESDCISTYIEFTVP